MTEVGVLIPASEGFSAIAKSMGGAKNPVIVTSFRYSELGEAIEAMRRCANIYIESHMINSPDFLDVLQNEVGLRKVIFGSNAPLSYMTGALKQIEHSHISSTDKEMVLGRNLGAILAGAEV